MWSDEAREAATHTCTPCNAGLAGMRLIAWKLGVSRVRSSLAGQVSMDLVFDLPKFRLFGLKSCSERGSERVVRIQANQGELSGRVEPCVEEGGFTRLDSVYAAVKGH